MERIKFLLHYPIKVVAMTMFSDITSYVIFTFDAFNCNKVINLQPPAASRIDDLHQTFLKMMTMVVAAIMTMMSRIE